MWLHYGGAVMEEHGESGMRCATPDLDSVDPEMQKQWGQHLSLDPEPGEPPPPACCRATVRRMGDHVVDWASDVRTGAGSADPRRP